MGAILDVVYNHTAKVDIFEDLEPNYYHFMDADGTPRTSFGGGRLGTTHHMTKRLLVDSIKYLVDTYKVDGFRFDMMETMTPLLSKKLTRLHAPSIQI